MQVSIPSTSRSASLALQPVLRRALSSSRYVGREESRGLTAREGPEDWLRKQMRLADRMENRKTKMNIKVGVVWLQMRGQQLIFWYWVGPCSKIKMSLSVSLHDHRCTT